MQIRSFSTADEQFNPEALNRAHFVAVHCNMLYDLSPLSLDRLSAQVHGATSCLGAMTQAGVTEGAAFFAIEDELGAYGTAAEAFDTDPVGSARSATLSALRRADRIGETPDLIWVSSTPGFEEDVIRGIESAVGRDVPIIGGSAADNTISGDWYVFDKSQRFAAGVVVSVMFPSRSISFAYHNGYAPTEQGGMVTCVEGRRIFEIDNRPAFEVYTSWTDNALGVTAAPTGSESILSQSTLWPLGRKVADMDGVSSFLLAHPATAHGDGSIDLFASVEEGEFLTQMSGTKASLIERAGRVATLARAAGRMETQPIAGALMVYCGGCMLSVRDRLGQVVGGVSESLDGAPFLGTFTFGEQGQILGAGNRHGNLMISCIVFG
ncbi:MAG: FIST C-terminal domain-containing protein [Rhodobacteraceae bacterium]|nr:FIST C-terminal domain-containing protein [Paracoccaceae bacterium]